MITEVFLVERPPLDEFLSSRVQLRRLFQQGAHLWDARADPPSGDYAENVLRDHMGSTQKLVATDVVINNQRELVMFMCREEAPWALICIGSAWFGLLWFSPALVSWRSARRKR